MVIMKDAVFPRLGTFFILVGLLFLIIFIGSILGRDVNLKYLGLSFVSFFLGAWILRTRKKPEPTRFSSVRKIQSAHKNKKAEKLAGEENQDNQSDSLSRATNDFVYSEILYPSIITQCKHIPSGRKTIYFEEKIESQHQVFPNDAA